MNRKVLSGIVIVVLLISAVGAAFLLMSPSGETDISIAYSEKVNYETLMVANANGYFSEEGVNVDVKLVTGGIEAASALITGAVDLAVMGDAPAVQLMANDDGARVVARLVGGEGAHRFIAWNDIQEPKELEGMKVGLQQTSGSHGAFLQWAEANGVNVGDITFVYMNPRDIPLAMQTRQIDAMGGSEPWALNTEKLCGSDVHEIGNSSGLGSTFPIVVVASERAMSERPEAIRAVLRALDHGNQYILEDWNGSMAICSERTGLSVEDQSFCSSIQFFDVGFNETDLLSMNMTAMGLLEFGKISEMPDIMGHVDLSFLPPQEGT
ncbi:MAG: ABC transporter substrate-binding protein [Euryarchaeota archaeon]|nr:ABC transporter substrate-binding protein [Euryarchaeota archaeon]